MNKAKYILLKTFANPTKKCWTYESFERGVSYIYMLAEIIGTRVTKLERNELNFKQTNNERITISKRMFRKLC